MTKTTINNNLESVLEYLTDLSDSDKVAIHNEYCQSMNYCDNEIYTNDEDFFNTFFDGKVIDAVRAATYGDFNYSHEYVIFNGYGNLESFNYVDDRIDLKEIAADILEHPENYYDIELEEADEETETN